MLHFFLAVIVFSIASLQWGFWGIVYGAIMAYLLLNQLQLKQQIQDLKVAMQLTQVKPLNERDSPIVESQAVTETFANSQSNEIRPVARTDQTTQVSRGPSQSNPLASFSQNIKQKIIHYFSTGNVIAKVGILLLFFGVSFLIKYVALHSKFPIELRLITAALMSIVLLGVGWRLRSQRREYGLILQGGGIGLLYIITYAAFRFYGLLPAEFTFLFLLLITLGSIALALLQNAQSLVYLAALGGFLAPLLTAADSHNPLGLFSYYTLLNLMIVIIAWYKTWRLLNITGFIFTFVISSIWGYFSYKPEYFLVTESFLVVFFLLYFVLAILYTAKQPLQFKSYVDATLVFGLPLSICTLQAILVGHILYGQAISALVLAWLYAITATVLFRLNREKFSKLIEAFIGLAAILGTLAIPLTLSGQWTSVIWAIEASCIIWLGFRQQRLLARAFGYLLQIMAQLIFWIGFLEASPPQSWLNFYCLGAVLIAMANFITSWLIDQKNINKMEWEPSISLILFGAGIAWWILAGSYEIYHFVPKTLNLADYFRGLIGNGNSVPIYSMLLFFAFSAALACYAYKKLSWERMSYTALALFPTMILLSLMLILSYQAWFPWLCTFTIWYWILRQHETLEQFLLAILHQLTAWFSLWQIAYWFNYSLAHAVSLSETWALISWGAIPLLALGALQAKQFYRIWPLVRYTAIYRVKVSLGLIGFLGVWLFYSNLTSNGAMLPLPYLPLLNPLDVICILSFTLIIKWYLDQQFNPIFSAKQVVIFINILGGLVFFWLNMLLVRSLHNFAAISFNWEAMFNSRIAQTVFSIFWTMIAVSLISVASRFKLRKLWFVGLALIGLVTLKLFFIDLLMSSMLLRTVSFCAVGMLLLLIGYFGPLPPSSEPKQRSL